MTDLDRAVGTEVEYRLRTIAAHYRSCGKHGTDPGNLIEREIADATVRLVGLLATARTRPTREDVRSVMWQWFSPDDYRIADKVTDAVLALWADRPTEAEAGARALEQAAEAVYTDSVPSLAPWLLTRAARLRAGER